VLDDPVHDADAFGETPARRLESRGAAHFLVCEALSEGLVAAVVTLAAGDVMKDYDPVAGGVFCDSGAYGRDDAGGFMSEDARGGVGAGSDLFQVCAANAAGVHAEEQLSRADGGDGDGFKADVVYSSVDGSQHRRRNRLAMVFNGDLSGNAH
jgi:hypothetical protein